MNATCIDLFAGAGGFTTGAELAGVRCVWSANHWPVAVETYRANHPDVPCEAQDLRQADWTAVPDHDVLLGSPACQGHCRARGVERPHHDAQRATAWAVVDAVEAKRPEMLVVENVPEFAEWELYPYWVAALERLGYTLTAGVLNAADFGVPQDRQRWFVVGRRSKASIQLPRGRGTPWVPARKIIDWDAPAGSRVATLCRRTRERVAHGRRTLGKGPMLMAYYGTAQGCRSLDRPIGTVTTRERYALVQGDRLRMLTVAEYRRAMGFPAGYVLPRQKRLAVHLLGNAVCPPVAWRIMEALCS